METILPIIVQIVTGIIGGQAVGAAIKQAAMSQLPKILSGAIGGVAGGLLLNAITGGSIDPAAAAEAAQFRIRHRCTDDGRLRTVRLGLYPARLSRPGPGLQCRTDRHCAGVDRPADAAAFSA